MKKFLSLMLVLLLSFSIPTFAADESIVDIASNNPDFSILVAALQKANLVDALQGDGPFTVFAPTNEAFEKLLGELGITADQLLNHPQLSEVLLYHVISGEVKSTDLSDGLSAETLNGKDLVVDLKEGVKINDSNVVSADLMASNGVIHVIDTVLVPDNFKLDFPSTVVDIALSSPDFSMLVSLLQKADLVSALQGEGPFTVFAPTNAAFEKLLSDLNITASDLMAQPDLAKVLLYHVVPGKVMSSDLSDGLMANTLNNTELKFDLTSNPMVNNSNITTVDLEAGNGVVHVVDTVLVPSNFNYQVVEQNTDIPKTGTLDLTNLGILTIIILLGAVLVNRKIKA
jgi:Secreted and surface protein containing fasciclin-like repeats